MTAEQLISMAREAGLPMTLITESSAIRWSEIKRFAKLVAAAERRACKYSVETEREACAKTCENVKLKGREVFADAIRARGKV